MADVKHSNWSTITPSAFAWEQEGLDYIRAQFPDHEPYRAWSNFEFIADDGSINEVDLLVFTPKGFFLIEIKSRPGVLGGDTHTWTWQHNGRRSVMDNPLYLANQKAKRLISLLNRQRAMSKLRVPYLDTLIFCSADDLQSQLQGNAGFHICFREQNVKPGVMAAITHRDCPGLTSQPRGTFDRPMGKAISRAIEQIGIKPTRRSRQVGDYLLESIIDEGPGYQDFVGKHVALHETYRRIRIYLHQPQMTKDEQLTVSRAAEREFRILQALEHRGVLRAMDFTIHELGPAILFQHFPSAIRLDHYLIQNKEHITDDLRLHLTREIANTINFAHGKHVVHRNLSPRNILILNPDSATPQAVITNWQLGYRQNLHGSTSITQQVTATVHIDHLAEETTKVYMAPETFSDHETLGEHHDIFSLGAICYQLFTGQSPAENPLALAQKLRTQGGLLVSSVMTGPPSSLEDLVKFSTNPNVSDRLDSAGDFLELLDDVENELTTPDNLFDGDPTHAKAQDILPGGYTVIRKLGTGSTATALLVSKDDQKFVAKIAVDVEHNDRIKDEGEVLQKLSSPLIVRYRNMIQFGDRNAILIDQAGDKTLRKRLADEGTLSLDLLQRFGEDLLQAVLLLERQGIAHRDIKPENIGVRLGGKDGALHLVLFDFSLSRCNPQNIRAGTIGYLDPFLSLRNPPRWDLHAERYAACVTLYQMATGSLPVWHDGITLPDMVDCEVTLDASRFDSHLRDDFTRFFTKALRRDPRKRFDNASQLLEAWQQIYTTAVTTNTATDHTDESANESLLAAATRDTNVSELGLGPAAVDALDRINVLKVRDLLQVRGIRLARMRGVGNKTRKHILAAVKILRDLLATEQTPSTDDPSAQDTAASSDAIPNDQLSIEALASRILRSKSKSSNATETTAIEALLGYDPRITVLWPSQGDVAPLAGVTRGRISQILTKAQNRWVKDPAITAIRDHIAALLQDHGSVMSVQELCQALITTRGCLEDEPQRTRLARVVARASVETEGLREEPKFILRRIDGNALISADISLTDYAIKLGRVADDIASLDPLLPNARVIEKLREVALPPEAEPFDDARLVHLAAASSKSAAISSRGEIYPRNMEPGRAIRLSHNGLAGVKQLTPDQIRQRVAGRYPHAAAIPPRPQLDNLLIDAGFELRWSPADASYHSTIPNPNSISSVTTTSPRLPTAPLPKQPIPQPRFKPNHVDPDIAEAAAFETRLTHAQTKGSYLALSVKMSLYTTALTAIQSRFDIQFMDTERLFIQSLKQAAAEINADWATVVAADAASPQTDDWRNLNQLITSAVIPRVEQAILQQSDPHKTTFACNLNWLARYGQIDLLSRLAQAVHNQQLHGLWLFIPADSQSQMPQLDHKAVPVITANQWAYIPDSWCENKHRAN